MPLSPVVLDAPLTINELMHQWHEMERVNVRNRSWSGLPRADWFHMAKDAITTMTRATERQQTLIDVATSSLSIPHKMHALRSAPGHDWLDPQVQAHIEPMLSTDELARLQELPWSKGADNAVDNMHMVVAYCPNMGSALASLVDISDWKHREKILEFAATVKGSSPTIERHQKTFWCLSIWPSIVVPWPALSSPIPNPQTRPKKRRTP